ncbi:MAG: CRTAC1 family protein [Verrucomicrobiaceae bacterium]|nr:CRTAC1 family protein [Verrucomicrobiaceae bacterium]
MNTCGAFALICVIGFLAGCARETANEPPINKQAGKSFQEELEGRKSLDETVWKEERLAQFYEQRIVRLWDELRRSPKKLETLSLFPFGQLDVPGRSSAIQLDNGIQRTVFNGGFTSYSKESFGLKVKQLIREGFVLIQSEWHHQRFDFNEASKVAGSEVSFSLHCFNDAKQRMYMVSGVLDIIWKPMVKNGKVPDPHRIQIKNLSLLERSASGGFGKVAQIDARELKSPVLSLQPLIAYDLNRDGLSEVILGGVNRVFWNKGNGQFKPEPFIKHWPGEISESGLLADLNGDGFVDFLCISARNRSLMLFPGDEQGRFQKPGASVAPVSFQNPSVLTAGDIDADGDLDCWVTQYKPPYIGGQMPTPYYDANDGFASYLLINQGNGQFKEVTKERGLDARRNRRTYSASFVDLDGDNDLDLMVVSDFAGVDLYRNDGKGFFTDVRDEWVKEWHNFGMAHTFGDYDHDGRLDFYVIGMSSTTARRLSAMGLHRQGFQEYSEKRPVMGYGNRMYLGRDKGYDEPVFREQVARTGWSWGCSSFDFENDGDLDVYVANGYVSGNSAKDYCSTFWCHDLYTGSSLANPVISELLYSSQESIADSSMSWNGFEKNALLMNRGGKGFTNIGFLMNVALSKDCRGVVSDDLDGDGLVDLLVIEQWQKENFKNGQILHVYRNETKMNNNWIGVRLAEQGRQGHAVGARITLHSDRGTQIKQIVTGDSFFSQHAPVAHFGLGKTDSVDRIDVRWPSGRLTSLKEPAIRKYHTIHPEG